MRLTLKPLREDIAMLEFIATIGLFFIITTLVYSHVGLGNIVNSYKLWFQEGYWVNYNVVEAISWVAKAAVILPGLVWQKEIWQLGSNCSAKITAPAPKVTIHSIF